MAKRLAGNDCFTRERQDAYSGKGPPVLIEDELSAPLRRKKPAIIGVQFMGDLFHESVSFEWVAAVFGVVASCPQHSFVILTKRAGRMVAWFDWLDEDRPDSNGHQALWYPFGEECAKRGIGTNETLRRASASRPRNPNRERDLYWPLPNLILGVSIEDQPTADERIPLLLQVQAAKRIVSAEPLLAGVDFGKYVGVEWVYSAGPPASADLPGKDRGGFWSSYGLGLLPTDGPRIDGLIVGAETGPGKRPMGLDWARSARDQCKAAGVPFFFKVDSRGNDVLDGRLHREMP
jgi:protein gp37